MPYLRIQTNASLAAADRTPVMETLSAAVANMLGKPESYVMVALETNEAMMFAGSDAPTVYVELKSLGLPEDETAGFSAALCDCISKQLGVPTDRIYIEFANPDRHMWGWDGRVF